ncbi:MAG: hypothetical protein RJB68_2174 [Pseudomonadota bacterium]|jgi:hypothetical protein
MKQHDRGAFAALIAGIYAYHRQAVSDAIIGVWWNGCQRWELEEVSKALDALTQDAEAGKFLPKIGDVTRVLQGTTTDKAAMAWGKVQGAMSSVGCWQDVCFDEPAIHAAIVDIGGWQKVCRTEYKEQSYLQHRFVLAYKAYTERGTFEFPRMLNGDRGALELYQKRNLLPPPPVLVGNPEEAKKVLALGGAGGPQIAFSHITQKLAIPMYREAA